MALIQPEVKRSRSSLREKMKSASGHLQKFIDEKRLNLGLQVSVTIQRQPAGYPPGKMFYHSSQTR
ncbi:hypothetical protein, partial [Enterobacter sp. PTB]|uniref:hypothetical protein n=1 Tax=Enterobacter sp. PTB TaxID=3143437 RepID=UPI003DA7E5D8